MTNRGALELEPRKPGICRKNARRQLDRLDLARRTLVGSGDDDAAGLGSARHRQVVENAASVCFPAQGWSAEVA
jgi:hypothetical protein